MLNAEQELGVSDRTKQLSPARLDEHARRQKIPPTRAGKNSWMVMIVRQKNLTNVVTHGPPLETALKVANQRLNCRGHAGVQRIDDVFLASYRVRRYMSLRDPHKSSPA